MRRRLLLCLIILATIATACSYETKDFGDLFGEDFSVDELETAQSSRVYDRNGTLITELRGEENRTDVAYADIPDLMVDAVVAIEDERFWDHDGVDLKAILRAARSNVSAGGISEGGSTITQQYVGNVFLERSEQTGTRKIEEIFMALRFEEQFTKEFILERYLNWVYFGNGAYGVEAAAREYFGAPDCARAVTAGDPDDRDCLKLDELELHEAALIAGLIQLPGANNPYQNPEGARDRRDQVLGRMLANEYITEEEYERAVTEPLDLVENVPILEEQYPAAHFVEEVKQWFLDNPEFGDSREERAELLFEGGLDIFTTIDLEQQRQAEAIVEGILPQIAADGSENPDAAVVVLGTTPFDDGHVLVMVGGRDYWSDDDDARVNLAAGEGRQAGSSMKPFALAAGLEMGIPMSEIYPSPSFKEFREPEICGPTWRVRGGGGGSSNLREATRWSRNTVFAQLMIDITPERFIDMSERLGIGEGRIDPVCAAVLGTENVNMVEMATAYSTLSRSGSRVDPILVTEIVNPDGTQFEPYADFVTEYQPVLDRGVADQVTDAMNEVIDNPGTGRRAQLDARPAAGKTGTAQNNADATFAGYTPQRTASVWVGYPEGQVAMRNQFEGGSVQGGTFPALIWGDIMDMMHVGLPVQEFPAPPVTTTTTIRPSTQPQVPVSVPDLVGLTVEEAQASSGSFSVSVIEVNQPDVAPGTIYIQSPPAGSTAPSRSTITVEVAAAPEEPDEPSFVSVPGVVGLSEGDARGQLGAAGFAVEVSVQANPDAESPTPGAVWAQNPGAGEEVAEGALVSIIVNPAGDG